MDEPLDSMGGPSIGADELRGCGEPSVGDGELPANGKANGSISASDAGPSDSDGPSGDAPPPEDDLEHRAALAVMLYLLFISTLLILAIIICVFVVSQYGVVVFAALCLAASAFAVVAATVTSVITRDAKLERARAQIRLWHATCQEEIIREVDRFREDCAAYQEGAKMIAYYDDGGLDYVGEGTDDSEQQPADIDESPHEDMNATKSKKEHRPKSVLFRYVVGPLLRPHRKARFSMRRKSKRRGNDADSGYQPPTLV